MRFPRMTTRRCMVLVAIVAGIIGLAARGVRFDALAEHHSLNAGFEYEEPTNGLKKWKAFDRISEHYWKYRIVSDAKHKWHSMLAKKYEHAARYPWLPVAPDPPEPE